VALNYKTDVQEEYMYQSQNALVVVDFRQDIHHALPRGIELARKFDTKLTFATCVYQPVVDIIPEESGLDRKQIELEAIAHYEDELRTLVELHIETSDSFAFDFEVIWHKSFKDGLVSFIEKNEFDLVVKTAHSHSTFKKLFFTPTDWHLLRQTTTNILFVKKGAWPSSTSIMGAINIEADDIHQSLNQKITEATVQLAKACDSEARILNVFPWPKIDIEKFKYLFEKKDQFLEIKNQHRNAVENFVKDYPELIDNVIIAEGLEPDETIPELIKSTYSDLLVMGCVGRKGIEGAMIGNTAEKILDQIDCEVLVLQE